MTALTNIARLVFASRMKALDKHDTGGDKLQLDVLRFLLSAARNTEYGYNHKFPEIHSYDDFVRNVPINSYDDVKGDIDRMRHGESDVLWQGRVKWYAKSSGTTNDKSKFIPVSNRGLQHLHYAGGTDAVVMYLKNNPKSRLFDGKSLILGGSHSPNYNIKDSLVGDLSSILIENINPLVNLVRVPKKSTALLSDFEIKRDRIARETLGKNITNISGVPSWMLSVLTRVMELTGKNHLEEVWPNIECFFHGGVAFTPYREQYKQLITSPNMHYMETYNASEGFFGLQNDPNDSSMLLMLDYDCFYEFIPMDEFGQPNPTVVPIWGVKTGVNYAMVISTSCGLWRYLIGDTVTFTSVKPYKFFISGRTKYFINAFGEELIQDNAEKGLEYACQQTGAEVLEYTAAPVFMDDDAKCRHQWLIEFNRHPEDLQEFASILDKKLQEINSDYEAKRYKDITLQPLEIIKARKGLFNDWLKSKGKLGGQHKVPRLSNNRNCIEEILKLAGSKLLSVLLLSLFFVSCANMGNPEGGLYDEEPPRIVATYPVDKSTNVATNKFSIIFDEYVSIENANEKVIVSPPQLEAPEIKSSGKKIIVELKDSLKPNTTYTIDFSDAIVDFREGNPLGNYTYSFSTGEKIDTFEVAGNVLDASNLEPVKGILVGLYDNLADSAFTTMPLQRVSRTDSRGRFIIKGVPQKPHRVYALYDMDQDFKFSQKGETIGFTQEDYTPSTAMAVRQDTLWHDSLHIDSIKQVKYQKFTPDDIVLLSFTEEQTERHLIKAERKDPEKFSLYFSYSDGTAPAVRGINFDEKDKFVIESSVKKDTMTYWLTDTALVNKDTLTIEVKYLMTDTLHQLVNQVDTIDLFPKLSYEKRKKLAQEEFEQWQKGQNKLKKKGLPYDSIMPPKPLSIRIGNNKLTPDGIFEMYFSTPLRTFNRDSIHLYVQVDTLWYRAPFEVRMKDNSIKEYEIIAEWREGSTYSLEFDTLAISDIYGKVTSPQKIGIQIGNPDEYSSLIITVNGAKADSLYVELLDKSDKALRKVKVEGGLAEFYYLKPGEYYLRAFEDDNHNGLWDSGLYAENRQAERIYYYNKSVECKEKWDVTMTWNLNAMPVSQQKPLEITKQKAEKAKTIRKRNAEYMLKHGYVQQGAM